MRVHLKAQSHRRQLATQPLPNCTRPPFFFKIGCSLVQTCTIYICDPDQGWPGMISMRYSPPSRRQEMLNRLPVGDCIMKSTKSSMFNRRRHLFSPRSVADLDTTAQLLWHVAVKTARRFIAELLTPRSDTSPRRDLHLLSRLEQTHCQPLSNYTQPLMMRANSLATASKPLMCPCRPSRLQNPPRFF